MAQTLRACGRGRIVDKPPVIYHLRRKADVKHRINAERLFGSYQTRLPPERLRLYELYEIAAQISNRQRLAEGNACFGCAP